MIQFPSLVLLAQDENELAAIALGFPAGRGHRQPVVAARKCQRARPRDGLRLERQIPGALVEPLLVVDPHVLSRPHR